MVEATAVSSLSRRGVYISSYIQDARVSFLHRASEKYISTMILRNTIEVKK